MKFAAVYVLNINYLNFFKYSLNSLLFNNIKNTFDIVLFYDTAETLENLKLITSMYNYNFIFKEINKNNYKINRYYNPYYRLEIFTLEEYDKILYLDCDTIICNEIDELFIKNIDFGAVKYFFYLDYYIRQFNIENYFNAGVLLIGKKYLNQANYSSMLLKLNSEKDTTNPLLHRFDQSSENEEPFINYCFNDINVPLPSIYNSSIYTSSFEDIRDIKIIHLQGISKFLYNLKTLSTKERKKNLYLIKRLTNDKRFNINFNIIAKIYIKIKKYIPEDRVVLNQIFKKLYK
jgi:lipopolysaccharide biosynthesis glycosyltransferase